MALTSSTHPVTAQDTDRKRKKRGAVIKLALAGAAIIGIGAAATSAAWTDDAWFNAAASSATVELQGSLDGVTWTDADTTPGITIPTSAFGNLLPGQTKTVTLNLKNTGSTSVNVASTVTLTGDVFLGTPTATVTVAAVPSIAANGTATVVVTLTTPAAWADTYQGKTGSATIRFTGTAV